MRILLLSLAIILSVAAGAVAREGGTLIGPGRTFMLGGEQKASILVRGSNPSTVSVRLLRSSRGRETVLRDVPPGARFSERFGAGETVLFRNTSRRQASIDIKLTPELYRSAMRYDRENGER